MFPFLFFSKSDISPDFLPVFNRGSIRWQKKKVYLVKPKDHVFQMLSWLLQIYHSHPDCPQSQDIQKMLELAPWCHNLEKKTNIFLFYDACVGCSITQYWNKIYPQKFFIYIILEEKFWDTVDKVSTTCFILICTTLKLYSMQFFEVYEIFKICEWSTF